MRDKKIRITLLDILIYLSLTFLCMQFFTLYNNLPFCKFFDSLGLKHIFMIATVVVGFFSDLRHGKLKIIRFSYEIRMGVLAIVSLVVVSFVIMIFNGYGNYWVEQVYFLIIPLAFAYTVFKNDYSLKRFKSIINYLLVVSSILYTIFIIYTFFIQGKPLNFSFIQSESPFESEIAHFYLLMYIFYTFIGDTRGRIFSALFCVLAWKRISLICLILITIAGFMRLRNNRIKIGYIIAIAVIFSLIPFLNEYMLSSDFIHWFNEVTGLDFAQFSNFRYYALKAAIDAGLKSKGLGTFFNVKVPWYDHYEIINLHNDLMRLYLEVTIVGLFLYLLFTGAVARRKFSMFVILYLYIEMCGNHLIGNGGIPYWLMGYTLMFFFNSYDRDGLGNVFPADDSDKKRHRLKRHISVEKGKITIRK